VRKTELLTFLSRNSWLGGQHTGIYLGGLLAGSIINLLEHRVSMSLHYSKNNEKTWQCDPKEMNLNITFRNLLCQCKFEIQYYDSIKRVGHWLMPSMPRVLIHCCAALYSEARGPFDYFKIRVSILKFELARFSKWSNELRTVLHSVAQTADMNLYATNLPHEKYHQLIIGVLGTMSCKVKEIFIWNCTSKTVARMPEPICSA
jgi:hypothetical protein